MIVSPKPQLPQAELSAIPMRKKWAFVNATSSHTQHRSAAFARGILRNTRVCRRGYNLWRRALVYKFTGVSLCQRISSRASERSLVAASVLYSGISIQWTPSWTYRAASSELSLAWRNSAVTLCPLIDDDVPVVECVVVT